MAVIVWEWRSDDVSVKYMWKSADMGVGVDDCITKLDECIKNEECPMI